MIQNSLYTSIFLLYKKLFKSNIHKHSHGRRRQPAICSKSDTQRPEWPHSMHFVWATISTWCRPGWAIKINLPTPVGGLWLWLKPKALLYGGHHIELSLTSYTDGMNDYDVESQTTLNALAQLNIVLNTGTILQREVKRGGGHN